MNYHFFFSEIYGTTTQCKIKELPGQIIAQMVSASLNLFHITLFFFSAYETWRIFKIL